MTDDFIQCSWPGINQSGHVNELCIDDLRDIARATDLFTRNMVSSTSSFSRQTQTDVDKQTPKLEEFLGRKFRQEQLYDTIHFISKK